MWSRAARVAVRAGMPMAEALDAEAIGMMRTRETEDHKEALRAFMEKRAPNFTGR